jgi:tRNA nucleotidyltransferase (CCA-adding enzyme)
VHSARFAPQERSPVERVTEEAEESMPDYMYLLESRLSPEQRAALERVQELARLQESNLYLTGGAVRDLISGMPLRDLDFTIEGNPARIVRELEKGGARVVSEDERLRHYELIFAGDADGSISAARDEVYERPGSKPELRWSTVMEDLRRRDFSMNAVAISLNAASRGLLLDPTNGLADLEKHEVRALSIHAFTNQPIRLMRILRFAGRMGFKMEPRTQEWFELAFERGLHESLAGPEVGQEIRQLGREDNPTAVLKAWDARNLLGAIHPHLARRRPSYDDLARLAKMRESMLTVGLRPRLFAPVTYYTLVRLKPRERIAAMRRIELRSAEIEAVHALTPEAQKLLKLLKGRKTDAPKDAYALLAKTPPNLVAFLETEYANPRALNKIRNYLQKWRPLRASLPVAELDSLGVPRGPKFDKILEDLFGLQLRGKGRTPPDRTKLLRQLAGIKEELPKKAKEEKKKGKEKAPAKGKGAKAGPPEVPQGAPQGAARKAAASAGVSQVATAARAAKAVGKPPGRAQRRPVHRPEARKTEKKSRRR